MYIARTVTYYYYSRTHHLHPNLELKVRYVLDADANIPAKIPRIAGQADEGTIRATNSCIAGFCERNIIEAKSVCYLKR
jgi:hypothetical protein